eukprot:3680451-Amphidinium_carterae.1
MRTHKVGYDGTEVCVAEQLSFDWVVAALPPAGGCAGSTPVPILDLVDSGLAHLLSDPSRCLRPSWEWLAVVPRAKIWAETEVCYRLAARMVSLNILAPIEEGDIFCHNGQLVSNVAFGVKKSEMEQRFIMNLVPSNGFQRTLEGDIGCLPSS